MENNKIRLPAFSASISMWKALLLVSLAGIASAQSVSNIQFFNGGHSQVQVQFQATTYANVRMRYIPVSSGSCTSGTGGSVLTNVANGGPSVYGFSFIVSGLQPTTTYQFCPEVSADGVNWSSGVGATWTTLPLPTPHPATPIPPATFDTSYPNTSGYTVVNETNCSNLASDIATAISNQLTTGTVITLPAGLVCTGQVAWNTYSPDTIVFDSTKVNSGAANAIYLPNHGLTEGQAIHFGGDVNTAYGGGGMQVNGITCYGPCAYGSKLMFVHVVDANNFQIYPNWEQFTASTTNGSNVMQVQNMLAGYGRSCGFQNRYEEVYDVNQTKRLRFDCSVGVGGLVVGPGIPAGTTITGYNVAAGTVTLSNAATATQANVTVTMSGPGPLTLTPGGTTQQRFVKWPRPLNWIIIRTATPDSQFAPPGTRVNPQWASKMPVLQMSMTTDYYVSNRNFLFPFGQAAEAAGNTWTSHIRFTGVEFTYTTPSPATADPPAHLALIAAQYNNDNVIVDRCYFHMPKTLQDRSGNSLILIGSNLAVIDSYFDNMYYWNPVYSNSPNGAAIASSGIAPTQNSSTQFTITPVTVWYGAQNPGTITSNLVISWTGTPSSSVTTPEIAAYFDMSGNLNVVGPTGITITSSVPATISYTSTSGNGNCNGNDPLIPSINLGRSTRQAAAPLGCAVLNSSGQIASLAAPSILLTDNFTHDGTPPLLYGGSPEGPGPYIFKDNYIDGLGGPLIIFDDTGTPPVGGDFTIQRNTFHTNWTKFLTLFNPVANAAFNSDGYDYRPRQHLEWKAGQRIKIDGNIFLGPYHDRTQGELTFTPYGGTAVTDIDITNNTFAHVAAVFDIANTSWSGPDQENPGYRERVQNNLVWDLNSLLYSTGSGTNFGNNPSNYGAGDIMHPGDNALGTEDLIVNHNTFVDVLGRNPKAIGNSANAIEGLQFTNNIFPYAAGYFNGDNYAIYWEGNNLCGSANGGAALSSCGYVNPVFTNNVIIPGWNCSGYPLGSNKCSANANSNGQWSASALATNLGSWAAGNTILSDSSVNGSMSLIGWWNTNYTTGLFNATGDYVGPTPDFHLLSASTYNKGATDGLQIGANIDQLEAAQGKVTLVGASSISQTSATITYVAPDSQSCSVDYSSSDPTLINTFTRQQDSGGNRVRNVTLTGLTTKLKYYYRVNCAVQQPTGVFITN
jgi:hypothetical protein